MLHLSKLCLLKETLVFVVLCHYLLTSTGFRGVGLRFTRDSPKNLDQNRSKKGDFSILPRRLGVGRTAAKIKTRS